MLVATTMRSAFLDHEEKIYCNKNYLDFLQKYGFSTIIVSDYACIDTIVAMCDLLLISGGYDMHPTFTQEAMRDDYPYYREEVDFLDLMFIHAFHQAKKPVLGICRGMQIMNVYFGGTLFADIKHHQKTSHLLYFATNGLLHSFYPKDYISNSYHHQAIDKLGKDVNIEAITKDGIIEAISYEDYMIGLQWHPEKMENDPILLYFLWYLHKTSLKNKKS